MYSLLAHRPGWTVSEHPSGMLIWRSPTGRHYLHHPGTTDHEAAGAGPGRDPEARPALRA